MNKSKKYDKFQNKIPLRKTGEAVESFAENSELFDPQGSYIGNGVVGDEQPVQDSDDF